MWCQSAWEETRNDKNLCLKLQQVKTEPLHISYQSWGEAIQNRRSVNTAVHKKAKTSPKLPPETCGHGLEGGIRGCGEAEKELLLVKSGRVVPVRSQTQLLWPIYPRCGSRGRGVLDELAEQSMKQRGRTCLLDRGGGRWMRMMRSRWKYCFFLFFFLKGLSACDAGWAFQVDCG